MVKTELHKTREDGVKLYRSYSDSGLIIRQVATGTQYEEAIDVEGAGYTYEETDTPAEVEPPSLEERVDALEDAINGSTVSAAALTSMLYVSRLTLAGQTVDTDDKRIRASGLYEDWAAGKYAVGDIRNAEGQTWECFQAHDNAVYPDIKPGGSSWFTFWRPLHGKSQKTARPFVPVQGAHDMYRAGEWMIWTDGGYYECLSDTNFSPTDNPSAWAKRA